MQETAAYRNATRTGRRIGMPVWPDVSSMRLPERIPPKVKRNNAGTGIKKGIPTMATQTAIRFDAFLIHAERPKVNAERLVTPKTRVASMRRYPCQSESLKGQSVAKNVSE